MLHRARRGTKLYQRTIPRWFALTQLRDHRQVHGHSVALTNAPVLQHIGYTAHFLVQLLVPADSVNMHALLHTHTQAAQTAHTEANNP
jgi:hypothetical protein